VIYFLVQISAESAAIKIVVYRIVDFKG